MKNLCLPFLFFMLSICLLPGQVIYDNNGTAETADDVNSITFSNFNLPSGNDRLIVITVYRGFAAEVQTVTFNGTNFSQALGYPSYPLEFWYAVLGSGTAITADISMTFTANADSVIAIASSYQNIDQTATLGDEFAGTPGHDLSCIALFNSTPDNIGIDAIRFKPIATNSPGSSQTLIASGDINSSRLYSSNKTTVDLYTEFCWSNAANGNGHWAVKEFKWNNTPLPIQLVDFDGQNKGREVHLSWKTASELNNAGFEIQKSQDARHWEAIDFVEGQRTTEVLHNYTYIDTKPFKEVTYYRLCQIDYDESYSFSKVITVASLIAHPPIQVYPNPTSGCTNIKIANPAKENIVVRLMDNIGRIICEKHFTGEEPILKTQFDMEVPGFYYISVQIGSKIFNQRLVVKEDR